MLGAWGEHGTQTERWGTEREGPGNARATSYFSRDLFPPSSPSKVLRHWYPYLTKF